MKLKPMVYTWVLVLGAGCATQPDVVSEVLPSGGIAVVPARHAPEPIVESWSTRRAREDNRVSRWAASGAKHGAAVTIRAYGIGLIFPPLIPIAAVTGGLVGAASGAIATAWHSKSIPHEHAAPLQALAERSIGERLHAAVAAEFAQLGGDVLRFRLVVLPESGPRSPSDSPVYSPLQAQYFDAVVEITVTQAGLVLDDDEPHAAFLFITARTRAVPLADPSAAWQRELVQWSDKHRVESWRAEDGRLFEDELAKAVSELAKRLADELLS